MKMLGLKLPTDPRWVNIVEKNIEEILIDHAYCEQKAATNAITIIVKFPEYPDLVKAMIELCQEEMEHFGMVHDKLIERGYQLGIERKDAYVNDLADHLKTNYPGDSRASFFVNRMLFSAMIEARSCERFRLLSEEIADEDLRVFYRELMESEAVTTPHSWPLPANTAKASMSTPVGSLPGFRSHADGEIRER